MTGRRVLIEARNRTVAVEGGIIVEPDGRFDLVLRFPSAEVRPGLINAHEHLHRNHYGRLGAPPYRDAYHWAEDIQSRHRREIAAGRAMPRREALLAGAWKNLFAGVTTVVHHDRWEGAFEEDFPVRVVRIPCEDSLGMTPALDGVDPARPFCIHLAEGTGLRSAGEVYALAARGLLGPSCLAVHGVGLAGAGIDLFRASGAALVWCPSSNLFLLGRTAASELLCEGVDLLLGSDSLLTGQGNMLDELRVARRTGLVSDRRLEHAVGSTASRRLALPAAALRPGELADLVVLSASLLEAGAEHVELVMVGGVPRLARAEVVRAQPGWSWPGQSRTVDGVTRWAAADEPRFGGAALPARERKPQSTAERTIPG